jgi:hypothetical protein
MTDNRFQDQNYHLSHFQEEVDVVCPKCQKKALTTVNYDEKKAKLICTHCGFCEIKDTILTHMGYTNNFIGAANLYFKAELWYMAAFKNDIFFAYNESHLLYLEKYISAKIREHKDRKHFTLIEKLPKFYHEAKNREALLKIIEKLKIKK